MKKLIENIFYPFGKLDKKTKIILTVSQLLIVFVWMQLSSSTIVPKPLNVFSIFLGFLSNKDNFYDDFIATFLFVLRGVAYAMIASMILTYLRSIQFFQIYVDFVTKLRYLTFSTVIIIFTMMVKGGNVSDLKMALLMFGSIPFFVNSFVQDTKLGEGLPQYHLNKAYINKLNKWESLWQVVIIGKLDRLFLVIKSNFAIVWAVVTTVEANAMNEGGIGTIISKSNKHMQIDNLVAMGLLVLLVGVGFDFLYGQMRKWFFVYTRTK